MQGFLLVLGGLAAVFSVYVVLAYNGLVSARQRVDEGWSGIDVQLKRRSDLVPNLVETVKAYAAHESDLFDRVSRARMQAGNADPARRAASEQALGRALGGLLALSESYPDLKASRNFQDLHKALEGIEADIQHARRYFNGAVRIMNTKVQSFPSNLVARRFGFGPARFFELDAPAGGDLPKVRF
ncbi:LemA family protein [Paracoccus kondratievae]|uniref:LemA family protein n=1 Tax=Paracoccus kondratievae TaxID=135740 RepID=UPI00126667B0|nr:LemA family protein [Paracoccus kondratievae]QFQ86586.1 LemA family protein [Paracoccus kondratievae]